MRSLYELGQETIKLQNKCCREMGRKVRIETRIDDAPSYPEYLKACRTLVDAIKANR